MSIPLKPIASILVVIHFLKGFDAIYLTSPTFDEILHLAAGRSYLWEGGFSFNIKDHPPLAKQNKLLTSKEC